LDEPERPVPPKNTTVETREDGTKVETTTETTIDGIKVETVTETTTNGVVTQKETKVQTDGSSVVTTKTQGITVVVNKNTSGNIASAKAYCTITGSKTAVSAKASISKEVLQQVTSLSGTNQVKVTIKIQIPVVVKQKDLFTANQTQTAYTVTLNANDVKENNPLYIYAYDSNKKQYTMVNATTYKVQEDGSLSINVPAGKAYVLLNKTDMTKVSNKILSTVKLAATTKTMKPGKKTKVTLSKSLDMANVKKVTYLVSNKKVATVSSKGVVSCKKKGTVTVKVKVTLKNGKTKTLSMKVKINKK
ncbi:MAG: Ig-like domain-containing protein, partial [Lachnospiraceae bacterium]|nr:Ig-like domain-containing protein [Lachnospiraceae bacterium]